MSEIQDGESPEPTRAAGTTSALARANRSRRLLSRDTSAALVVLGAGLIAGLVVAQGQTPLGAVLEATGAPRADAPPSVQDATRALEPAAATISPTLDRAVAPRPEQPSQVSDRMAVLNRCPGQPHCYIYRVRRGDNLRSIASWFGISYATVLALNPQVRDPRTIHAGDRIALPTPRR